ncbi:unnamed protein product [Rhodiola kirilowii]
MATTRSHIRGHIKSKSRGHSKSKSQSKSRRIVVPDDSEEENKSFVEGKSFEVGTKKYRNNRDRLVSKLKPGDHIAAKRMSWYYEHHGIYEGEEKGYPSVIHFQGPSSFFYKLLGSDLSSSCIYKCGYEHPKEGKVVTSCIDCFSQRKTMFKMQYKLQKKNLLSHQDTDWNELKPGKLIQGYRKQKYYLEHYKKEQLHGHSSVPTQKRKRSSGQYTLEDQVRLYQMSSIRSSEQVLEVARQYTSPPYNLFCNNCEHFAVFCTTGENKSYLIQERHLTFVCKLRKCFCCLTASTGTSNSGNIGYEHLYPPAAKEEEEDEEENRLLAKRIKLY